MFTHQTAKEKLNQLIKENEQKLNVLTVEVVFDDEQNAHILAKRLSDNSYIVWSSYFTGEERTTYAGYHNGTYDLTLSSGVNELAKRAGRDSI